MFVQLMGYSHNLREKGEWLLLLLLLLFKRLIYYRLPQTSPCPSYSACLGPSLCHQEPGVHNIECMHGACMFVRMCVCEISLLIRPYLQKLLLKKQKKTTN